jgi:hypothetical protein
MAHLTISLGAPVVVPFRISRGWSGYRRARVWNAQIRWRSFCEAEITAVDRSEIKRSLALYLTGNSQRLFASWSGKDLLS